MEGNICEYLWHKSRKKDYQGKGMTKGGRRNEGGQWGWGKQDESTVCTQE